MKANRLFSAIIFSLLASPLFSQHLMAAPQDDTAIRDLLSHTWDKPNAKLTVNPVVVEGNYAIADWLQNEKGGRALLVKSNNAWQVMVCGGDGLKTEATLMDAGLSKDAAKKMVAALVIAEKNLPADTLKKLASFGNVVSVKDDAHNQHHQNHQQHMDHKAHQGH